MGNVFSLISNARACMVAGGHANKTYLSIKTSPALTQQLCKRVQGWINNWSHSVICTEYRPFTMEFQHCLVFLVTSLKGDL
jgi:hypothetical protein